MSDDERTTREVIEILGEDCSRCHAELIAAIEDGEVCEGGIEADYEYHARQLVRAIFAYVEAVTFSVKAWSAGYCMENDLEISPQERYFATDTEYELNDRGEVVETVAKISLARNIRFALSINRKAHGISEPFDASVEWWSCMRKAIRVRDRLTHPKLPGDLDVTGDDVVDALKAKAGFEKEVMRHIKNAAQRET
ncbi:hypothetical protein J2X16_003966 [Pelomonas aquatica]|uniref:Uncharacterized protein n=1 Tax=Pelomonas aquatica TaxID=431058 RepID=A0ABU1ZDG2_9BURK|nr:hypothetical protein [Pelomonas aquatica]MDR7298603.1 hypothetical protein [Pelomonas aquatica]